MANSIIFMSNSRLEYIQEVFQEFQCFYTRFNFSWFDPKIVWMNFYLKLYSSDFIKLLKSNKILKVFLSIKSSLLNIDENWIKQFWNSEYWGTEKGQKRSVTVGIIEALSHAFKYFDLFQTNAFKYQWESSKYLLTFLFWSPETTFSKNKFLSLKQIFKTLFKWNICFNNEKKIVFSIILCVSRFYFIFQTRKII
jgi:hypothetical protein